MPTDQGLTLADLVRMAQEAGLALADVPIRVEVSDDHYDTDSPSAEWSRYGKDVRPWLTVRGR